MGYRLCINLNNLTDHSSLTKTTKLQMLGVGQAQRIGCGARLACHHAKCEMLPMLDASFGTCFKHSTPKSLHLLIHSVDHRFHGF